MQVTVTTYTDVTACAHCPHCVNTMDGPECKLLRKYVYPEGRYSIHPDCPLNKK